MMNQNPTNIPKGNGPLAKADPEAFKALARLIAYEDIHASQGNFFGVSDEELHFVDANDL